MSPRMENESVVSKENVIWSICLPSGHRERYHFPRKHPVKIYFEKGNKLEKNAKYFFSDPPCMNDEDGTIIESSDLLTIQKIDRILCMTQTF